MSEILWGVSDVNYEGKGVLCVCRTRKDAEIVMRKMETGDSSVYNRYSALAVTPVLVVDATVEMVSTLSLTVELLDNGVQGNRTEYVRDEWEFDPLYPLAPAAWRWVRAPYIEDRGGRLEAYGTDHDLVRRTFAEKIEEIVSDPRFRRSHSRQGRAKQ